MWEYDGSGYYYPGIPARDLSDEEAQRYGVAEQQLPEYTYVPDPDTGAADYTVHVDAPSNTRRSRRQQEGA